MSEQENRNWMNTFVFVCDFSNFTEKGGWQIEGKVCQRTYFHVSQEAIATMIMSGSLSLPPAFKPRPKPPPGPSRSLLKHAAKKPESKDKLLTHVAQKFGVVEPTESIGHASHFQALAATA